jgi:hypothetical protein
MKTGTVELKLQDGTAIKIEGSADFVAAVTAVILEVGKGRSSEHAQKDKPEPQRSTSSNQFEGLPPMFSPQWQEARSLLLKRFERTPTVGEIFEFLRESSQVGRSTNGDSLERLEPEAPAFDSPRSQPGRINQRLCWSLKEAAERCGVSYNILYRAACRGDLKIIQRLWTNDGVRIRVATLRRERDRIFAEETKERETHIGPNREGHQEAL